MMLIVIRATAIAIVVIARTRSTVLAMIVFMIIMAVIGVTSPTLARALAEARGGTGPDPQTGQAARAPEAKNSTQFLGWSRVHTHLQEH